MNKEALLAMGLTEEQVKKVIAAHSKEIADVYIPKTRFDEVNTELKTSKEAVKERDKQLKELGNSKESVEKLQEQIKTLQEDNTKKDTEHETELKQLKLSTAIKTALGERAQDTDLVSGLVDTTVIKLNEDGTIASGLKEQLDLLEKNKPFLFKPVVEGGEEDLGEDGKEAKPLINVFGAAPAAKKISIGGKQQTPTDIVASLVGTKASASPTDKAKAKYFGE